jgi:hypothetical protein
VRWPRPDHLHDERIEATTKRKHIIFFSVVVLVCVATLIVFQMMGDGGYIGGGRSQQAIETAPVAPVSAP